MPDGHAPFPEQLSPGSPDARRDPVAPAQPCFGQIVGFDGEGRPRVSYPGLQGPAPVARTVGCVPHEQLEAAQASARPVFLAFLDGRPETPVIMSLQSMHDLAAAPAALPSPSEDTAAARPAPTPLRTPAPLALEVDGEGREIIEAEQELVLRCGDAAIVLRADGTVRVTGRDITTWARRRQRIRGGSVAIN